MPPFGFRKRERSVSPQASTSGEKRKAPAEEAKPGKGKATLFDTADAETKSQGSLEASRKFLDDLDRDEDDSSLSDANSDDFEDVPPAKRQKMASGKKAEDAKESDEDDEEMDWEDAIQAESSMHAVQREDEIGDVSISMNEDGSYVEPLVSAATGKKGPSKRERQIRMQTHCLHTMSLVWHNTVRNSWINDKQLQKILVHDLPPGVKQEVQKWKRHASGSGPDGSQSQRSPALAKNHGKRQRKDDKKNGRDWNKAAQSQAPDSLQTTNALLRLLKVLTAYWRKRFTVTTPGLRKQGYKDLRRLRNEIKSWEKDKTQSEDHGERIDNRQEFQRRAKEYEGSRDLGGQLFVALLRGLDLDVRMVANLQPAGFGWSKAEDANPPKAKKKEQDDKIVDSDSDVEVKVVNGSKASKAGDNTSKAPALKVEKPSRKSARGGQRDPINLDDSDSPLSDAPSDFDENEVQQHDPDDLDDDLSVIDVTPSLPKKKKSHKKFDRDLAFPVYWAEVRDPSSNRFFPVDPIVLATIASSDELLQTFEPRGKKAEISKQVICYVVAHAADGTAKDVTIRYLKRHQLPGKTKGVRMPVEKLPIYNRHGKVKRYEQYDWFRTVMSMYDRPEPKRTIADDLEEQTDLRPYKPGKEEKVVEKESLQGYKQSAEFVLEQHLRREEAIKPSAQPVKTFTAGKGAKAVDHPVYRREDVVACKTVESWHKEGRAIRMGEQPMKYVPMRAVTLIRKREMEDAQRETGEKLKQGLYSMDQTDWIIPPPIQNGVIPKNAFGNMDVYVPTMVPEGAVHLPLKGSAKICRKLQIDHAEACTGFEFGNQRAVPVLTGVVVAKENERLVKDAWRAERAEQKRKEDTKRTATALHWWRKMLLGLRVLERMRVEYVDAGGTEEEVNPFVLKAKREGRDRVSDVATANTAEDEMGGGFLPDDASDDSLQDTPTAQDNAEPGDGGFLLEDSADNDASYGGGFLLEDEQEVENDTAPLNHAPITPVSLQSMHQTDKAVTNDKAIEMRDDAIRQSVGTSNTSRGSKKQQPQKQRHKPNSRPRKPTITVSSSDEGELSDEEEEDGESSLSDLESESASNDIANEKSYSSKSTKSPRRRSSPQVVITPVKRSTKAKGKKKATPVRSPYFDNGLDEEVEGGEEELDDEEEVVKPRRTTARTAAKR